MSDGLKSLVEKTSDDAVTSSTLGKQTPDPVTLCPLVSEANKSPDDVMIQIRAGKSEVGLRITVSCSGSDIFQALHSQMNNPK